MGLGKVSRRNRSAINPDLWGSCPKRRDQFDDSICSLVLGVAHRIVALARPQRLQGVTLPFLKSLQIPLPPIKEQRRIVALLDEAFADIDTATANAETTSTMRVS